MRATTHDETTLAHRLAGRLHIDPQTPVSHHPDDRRVQIDHARGVLASPAMAACDATLAHACRILIALSDDRAERDRAADLLALIEGENK